jgi:hypothetical protein
MSRPDRSDTSSTVAAHRRALAAVKAHPLAAALAILTLALATIAATSGESRHTPRASSRAVSTPATGSHRVAPTLPATTGTPATPEPESRSAPNAGRERHRRVAAAHGQRSGRALWPRAALTTARRFLSIYLPYTYGQLAANAIQAATPRLRARIAANPPGVPTAIRRLHPRVTALAIIPGRIVDAGAGWVASASVSDRQQTYHVAVTLGQWHGRWLVTSILAPSG